MKYFFIAALTLAAFGPVGDAAWAQKSRGAARTGKSKDSPKKNKAAPETTPRTGTESDEFGGASSPKSSRTEAKADVKTENRGKPAHSSHFAGVSVELGYEATYGNGAVLHLYPASFLEIAAGAGYNSTGFKAGGGPGVLIFFTPSVGLLAGAAYVYSQGSAGTVSLDATFTPDGGGAAEKVKATKKYTVSAAQMLGAWAGLTFGLTDGIRLDVKGCYNKVLSGNQVTFDDKIQYDKDIAATNEGAFNKQFNDNADDLVQAGGPGVAFGLQFLF